MDNPFSITFGAIEESLLEDLNPAGRDAPPSYTGQNTNLWRMNLSPGSAPGNPFGDDFLKTSQRFTAMTMGAELEAVVYGAASDEAPAPSARNSVPPEPARGPARTGGPIGSANINVLEKIEQIEKVLQAYRVRLVQNSLVETRAGGRTLARTMITISGDSRTFLTPPVDPQQLEIHLNSVRMVVAQRIAYLKFLIAFDQAFLRASALRTSSALADIKMLPVIWKLIRELVDVISRIPAEQRSLISNT